MNTILIKIRNELLLHKGRTALVVFALMTGLWGIASILVTYFILQNDLNENFTATRPAHVLLTSKEFTKLDLAALRKKAEVESAEFRDFSIQRIEVHPGQWLAMWLYGVSDFNNFQLAKIYAESGNKIPAPGTLLIERNGLLVSSLKTGSIAKVRAGSKKLEIPISGISFDPAQAPATQDAFIYAYADQQTYTAISGEPANQRLLLRLGNAHTKENVQKLVQPILDDFKAQGIAIDSVSIPKFNEHPHQFQLNTLLYLQGSIGLLAFLMGMVLVSQLLDAILSQQIRQIGIMKAIGATTADVLLIYLTMVLTLGVLASIIAIPLAVVSAYAYAAFVAKILNFNILTTSLPLQVYAYLITAGLLLPLLASLPALLRGSRISVYDALSDYGIRQTIASKSRPAVRQFLPYRFQLAIRNTLRRKSRLAVTVVTMALGVAIFNTGFNVRQSLVDFLLTSRNAMKHDVQVVLKQAMKLDQALLPFRQIANINRMEAWNGGRGRLQTGTLSTDSGIGIVALPYNTDLVLWDVIQGRWLDQSTEPEIVLNQQAYEAMSYPVVGNVYSVQLKGQQIRAKLVGVIKEFDVAKIYIDKEKYDALVNPSHLLNSLMFVASDKEPAKLLKLKRDIEQAISQSDLSVLYVMSQAERAKIIYDHLDIILSIITFLALLVLTVSALGMAAATGINIMERTREIGVLRAIGATPQMIYKLFVSEGMIISVISIAAGLLLAWPLSMAAADFFGKLILGGGSTLNYALSSSGLMITIFLTVCFGWLASRIPARNAVSVSTRAALAYE